MGILDVNALKESKDQSKDITAALDAIKESDAYLFGSDEPIDNPVILGGGAGGIDSNTATLRAAMGLSAPSKE